MDYFFDEKWIKQLDEQQFSKLRQKEPMKYKNLCRYYLKIENPPHLQELALLIIKKKPEDRMEDEIMILKNWTSQFNFFKELNSKQLNVQTQLHQKCCQKMQYKQVQKGQTVFLAGEPADKFYIILHGKVNVLLPKNQEQITKDQLAQMKQEDQENENIISEMSIRQRVDRYKKQFNKYLKLRQQLVMLDFKKQQLIKENIKKRQNEALILQKQLQENSQSPQKKNHKIEDVHNLQQKTHSPNSSDSKRQSNSLNQISETQIQLHDSKLLGIQQQQIPKINSFNDLNNLNLSKSLLEPNKVSKRNYNNKSKQNCKNQQNICIDIEAQMEQSKGISNFNSRNENYSNLNTSQNKLMQFSSLNRNNLLLEKKMSQSQQVKFTSLQPRIQKKPINLANLDVELIEENQAERDENQNTQQNMETNSRQCRLSQTFKRGVNKAKTVIYIRKPKFENIYLKKQEEERKKKEEEKQKIEQQMAILDLQYKPVKKTKRLSFVSLQSIDQFDSFKKNQKIQLENNKNNKQRKKSILIKSLGVNLLQFGMKICQNNNSNIQNQSQNSILSHMLISRKNADEDLLKSTQELEIEIDSDDGKPEKMKSLARLNQKLKEQISHFQNDINFFGTEDIDYEYKDILKLLQEIEQEIISEEQSLTNDEIKNGLGGIKLSELENLDDYIKNGILKHKYVITLETGQMFGELGIVMNQPRLATILAQENCGFAILNSSDFKKILQQAQNKKVNDKIDFFQQNMLQKARRKQVVTFAQNFDKVKFNKGTVIFQEGQEVDSLIIIKKGTVDVYKQVQEQELKQTAQEKTSNLQNIKQFVKDDLQNMRQKNQKKVKIPISTLGFGQTIGDIEIIQQTNSQCTYIASTEKLVVYKLKANLFMNFLKNNPSILQEFNDEAKIKKFWIDAQVENHRKNYSESKNAFDQLLQKQSENIDFKKHRFGLKKSKEDNIKQLVATHISQSQVIRGNQNLNQLNQEKKFNNQHKIPEIDQKCNFQQKHDKIEIQEQKDNKLKLNKFSSYNKSLNLNHSARTLIPREKSSQNIQSINLPAKQLETVGENYNNGKIIQQIQQSVNPNSQKLKKQINDQQIIPKKQQFSPRINYNNLNNFATKQIQTSEDIQNHQKFGYQYLINDRVKQVQVRFEKIKDPLINQYHTDFFDQMVEIEEVKNKTKFYQKSKIQQELDESLERLKKKTGVQNEKNQIKQFIKQNFPNIKEQINQQMKIQELMNNSKNLQDNIAIQDKKQLQLLDMNLQKNSEISIEKSERHQSYQMGRLNNLLKNDQNIEKILQKNIGDSNQKIFFQNNHRDIKNQFQNQQNQYNSFNQTKIPNYNEIISPKTLHQSQNFHTNYNKWTPKTANGSSRFFLKAQENKKQSNNKKQQKKNKNTNFSGLKQNTTISNFNNSQQEKNYVFQKSDSLKIFKKESNLHSPNLSKIQKQEIQLKSEETTSVDNLQDRQIKTPQYQPQKNKTEIQMSQKPYFISPQMQKQNIQQKQNKKEKNHILMLDQIENDTDPNVHLQYLIENQHNLNDYQIQQHQLMQLQQFQQMKSQSEKLNQKYKKYSTPNLTQPNQAQYNNKINDNLNININNNFNNNINNNYNNENQQKKDNYFKHKPQQQQAYISSFNLICSEDNNQPEQLQQKQNQEQEISSSLKLKLKLNSDQRRFMNVIFQGQRLKLDRQFQQEDDKQNKNPQDKFLDSIKFSLEMMKKKQKKNKSFHESQDKNEKGKSLNNGPTVFQSKSYLNLSKINNQIELQNKNINHNFITYQLNETKDSNLSNSNRKLNNIYFNTEVNDMNNSCTIDSQNQKTSNQKMYDNDTYNNIKSARQIGNFADKNNLFLQQTLTSLKNQQNINTNDTNNTIPKTGHNDVQKQLNTNQKPGYFNKKSKTFVKSKHNLFRKKPINMYLLNNQELYHRQEAEKYK